MQLPKEKDQKEWLTNQLEAVRNENLSHLLQRKMNELEVDMIEIKTEKTEDDEEKLGYYKKNIKALDSVMEVNDKKVTILERWIAQL